MHDIFREFDALYLWHLKTPLITLCCHYLWTNLAWNRLKSHLEKKKSKNWPRPAFRPRARDLIFFLVCDRSCVTELWKFLAQKYILRFWRKVHQNDRNLNGYQIKERNTCLFGVKRVILVKNQTCFQKALFSIDCDRSCMTELPILVTGRF